MTTKKEIAEFYHAAVGRPVNKTRFTAIKQNIYKSWPGLNEYMVRQHLEVRKLAILGHKNAQRSGTQTTQKKEKAGQEEMKDILTVENESLENPVPGILIRRERQVGMYLVTVDELKGYIPTNLCVVYPTMSNRGMKYILVFYDYYGTLIAARLMKLNKGAAIIAAYESIYVELTEAGITSIL